MLTPQVDRTQRALARQYRQYAAMRTDVGLVMTEQCPVGCRHCLASCTMQASDLPALETHLAWITKVSRVDRCKSITITGGEPFVYFQRLLKVVGSCRTHGLSTTVFTSAYWATSDEIAALRLQQLARAGLTGITVSSDEYHQESIPLANVARVLRASKERGIAPRVSLTYLPRGRSATQVKRDLRRELGQHALEGVQVEGGKIVKAGRACELVFSGTLPSQQPKLVCNALGPVIQRDGTVASCCRAPLPGTSPLIIGDLRAEGFEPIYQRFLSHPIIPFIQTWGLIEMLERLIDEGLAAELAGYRNAHEEQICQLCQAILSEQAHVSFFAKLFQDPEVRRRLGILTFVLYGDPVLLEAADR
jgi:MoaA/NifB/PqqE/SkfB family radical SAM enzyme